MQGHDRVAAAISPPRQANIAHHADEPAAGNQRVETALPDLVQFVQEAFVAGNIPELAIGLAIFLEGPVRGRGEDEVHTLGRELHFARVPQLEAVRGGYLRE